MMNNPRVSVLMSVYNAERFLREAVDSVLSQTFHDFEFIIFEDKSNDGSLEILKSYHDARIVLVENAENRGLTNNLIKGTELAKGDYVARMDADDVCRPHRLQAQVSFLDQNADISAVGSAVIFFDGAGYEFVAHQPVQHDEIKCELLYGFTMLHPSVMLRKADFDKHDLNYDPHFVYSQDHDLWTRAIRRLRFANIYEPLLKMREHPTKLKWTQRSKQGELSNEIRKRQLDELGVNCTDEEMRAFNKAAGGFPAENAAELRRYEMMLQKIFKANQGRPIFEQHTLQLLGVERFRGWCREALLNKHKWGRYYWRSGIRDLDHCTVKQKLGLLWRSAFAG